ncbi:T9SS type A sorting domain-containing protein [candidate division WOR-3 bacterium]|nr:T9SS type A sorting domain-containing protein [candidate division WOR-3 bacterium]
MLPRGIYDSTAVTLRLERLAGQRVVLAGLKLYEFEVIEKDGGAGQAGHQQQRVTEPSMAAYPNPFSRGLSVYYALPRAGVAAVKVFDIAGREVRCLLNGAAPAGTRTLVFDGRDSRGRTLPAGVYLLRLETEGRVLTEKVIMSR